MLEEKIFQQVIEMVKDVRSQGINKSAENFLESLGITDEAGESIVKALLLIKDYLADSWFEFFEKAVELAKYAEDIIVRNYIIFKAGEIRGIELTRRGNLEECMEKIQEAYLKGLKEGLSSAEKT